MTELAKRRESYITNDPAESIDSEDRRDFEGAFLKVAVSDQISALLEDLELTQAVLAERLGKSEAWVSRALGGRQNLTLDSLAQMGWALGLRWDPRLIEAPTAGTPAIADPPLPDWVGSMSADVIVLYVDGTTERRMGAAFSEASGPTFHFPGGVASPIGHQHIKTYSQRSPADDEFAGDTTVEVTHVHTN